jgi:hypothetical protein
METFVPMLVVAAIVLVMLVAFAVESRY